MGLNPGYCLLVFLIFSFYTLSSICLLICPLCLPPFPNLANLLKLQVWSQETTNVHPAGVLFKLHNGKMSLWSGVWLCVCFLEHMHSIFCSMRAYTPCLTYMHVGVYVYACVFHLWNIPVDYCFVYVLLPQQARPLGSYICKHHALRGLLRVCVFVRTHLNKILKRYSCFTPSLTTYTSNVCVTEK